MNTLPSAPVLSLVAVSLLVSPQTAVSQEQAPATVHWAYSAYFGSGWYSVPGNRDVFVARMTYRQALSDASLDADGNRVIGKYLKFPVSVGLNRFDLDNPLDAADPDNISFLSVNPGIDIEVPVNDAWSLRPYASVGYGRALGSDGSAWSYWGGIKSRYSFKASKLNWHLLNQVGFAGYTPNEGPSDVILPVMAGLQFDHPVGKPADQSDQKMLHWHVAYWRFGNSLEFDGIVSDANDIKDQWEIGAALARRESPIRIWFLKFDRLGLGYRVSSDGALKGVTFIFRSLFDE
jgi:hypothetical protein